MQDEGDGRGDPEGIGCTPLAYVALPYADHPDDDHPDDDEAWRP